MIDNLVKNMIYSFNILGQVLLIMLPLIFCVAYLTYTERKIIAAMQLRVGPNVVGPFGLLQPIADAFKLMHKEIIIPEQADRFLFLLAPVLTFTLAMVAWAVIPFNATMVIADINVGLLYLFAVSSLGVYGIIIAGWASNSKYAFLGAIRSVAQMISYEVSIGLIMVTVLVCVGSLRLTDIVEAQRNMWFIIPLFPLFIIFFIATLAETNRAPFDLPVAEAEIVGGYHVEYSSTPFALFFLSEYANMILMSAVTTLLFLGGWLTPFNLPFLQIIPGFVWFALKISCVIFLFLWIRATLPRYRYDQLMYLGWKVFLPFSLFYLIMVSSVLFYYDKLPS